MPDNRPIGVFDSGLGGLTVAKEIIKLLPGEDMVYFGDTGRVPYGNRGNGVIRKYAVEDERFLINKDVKLIVAACGTVSSVAPDTGDELSVPFFEMITHAARQAVNVTKNKIIGVLGTPATVNSESHKKAICKLMPDAEVIACSCPMFVYLVEEGWCSPDDVVVTEIIKRYLQPIIESGADTLILGCTHYPVLEKAIRSVVGNIEIINPGTAVAQAVSDYLNNTESRSQKAIGEHKFYVSDKPQSFKKTASVLLGENIDENKVIQVELDNL